MHTSYFSTFAYIVVLTQILRRTGGGGYFLLRTDEALEWIPDEC